MAALTDLANPQTDGSITSPSRRAGIVGLKPTPGLASRYGVVPLSESQDTVGPMVRWVKDAALVLQSIAGAHVRPLDEHSLPR
jgi:amidase